MAKKGFSVLYYIIKLGSLQWHHIRNYYHQHHIHNYSIINSITITFTTTIISVHLTVSPSPATYHLFLIRWWLTVIGGNRNFPIQTSQFKDSTTTSSSTTSSSSSLTSPSPSSTTTSSSPSTSTMSSSSSTSTNSWQQHEQQTMKGY